jgi:cytoskeletal protein RodZ
MLALFGDNMHSPATKVGRRTTPSLKKLFAVMAGFLVVLVILAELASATTNDQPAIAQVSNQSPTSTTPPDESVAVAAPVENAPDTARPNSLSYGANEIVKMYKGGVKAGVLLTYIETANLSYQLSSKEILYLSQSGVPSEIVNAMIRRDHQTDVAGQQVQTPPLPQQSDAAPVVYSQPQTTVVVQSAPNVKYAAPVCSTPVCTTTASTSPNVTIIGSRYGSTFFNGCYSGPISPRAFYNYEFGNQCWTSPYYGFGFGYRNRFAYDGFGGYGRFGSGRRWGRF